MVLVVGREFNDISALELNSSKISQKEILEFRLNLVEKQIAALSLLRDQLQEEKNKSVKSFLDQLPFEALARFLSAKDLSSLSLVCRNFRTALTHNGHTIMPHISASHRRACVVSIRNFVCLKLCLPSVESLHLNIGKKTGEAASHFLLYLSRVAGGLINLKSFSLVGGAAWGNIAESTEIFFANLPLNTLTDIHLSGLPTLAQVGRILTSQKDALVRVKVDYLCANHGTTVDENILPGMSEIEEIIFDVADLSEMDVAVFLRFLKQIKNPDKLKTLYFPHVQILAGSMEDLRSLIEEVKRIAEYRVLTQLVLRFHSLCLPLMELYALREALHFLPACCLSRTFLVALDHWAAWWPPILDVWKLPSQVTARAVFKEQIDFGSLDTCGDREWLRLSKERKLFWQTQILPKITKFWILEHNKPRSE